MFKHKKVLSSVLAGTVVFTAFATSVNAGVIVGSYNESFHYDLYDDGKLWVLCTDNVCDFDYLSDDILDQVTSVEFELANLDLNGSPYLDIYGAYCDAESLCVNDVWISEFDYFTLRSFSGINGDSIRLPEEIEYDNVYLAELSIDSLNFCQNLNIEKLYIRQCDNLESARIPDSVDVIGIDSCKNLKSLFIPHGVTQIIGDVSGLDSLTDVYYQGNSSDWEKIKVVEYSSKDQEYVESDLTLGDVFGNADIHYKTRTGWYMSSKGDWVYYDMTGTLCTGWTKIGTDWYYFASNGYMVKGWHKSGSDWYYLDSVGKMITGWYSSGGYWYYFDDDGAMVTGWKLIDDYWYFFGEDGDMKRGWIETNGKWYYLKSDGTMASKEYIDGYWLNEDGSWTYKYRASWRKDDKGWWYGDTSGWYAKNETLRINGKDYNFDAAGYCTNP